MKKYNILKPELAIGCYPKGCCLVYGNNRHNDGIALLNNFLKVKDNFENHYSRVYNVPSDFCLSGENEFRVEEVEVVLCTWCSLWPWGRFSHQVGVEGK